MKRFLMIFNLVLFLVIQHVEEPPANAFLSEQSSDGSEPYPEQENEEFQTRREKMVREQLFQRGIRDEEVLKALRKVPRHLFVSRDLWEEAYEDRPLPIGQGQTISQPYIVGLMTQLLEVKPGNVVLEVGTGSGYQAAVLAELEAQVYTIEIFQELGEKARDRLKRLGYNQVEVKIGDGYYGWEEHAPFDAIVVTAAVNHIPPPLIQQLKPGGRMVIPVGNPFQTQNLMLVRKLENGEITVKNILPVMFVPLLGPH
jgi:protein-L-isoaspartate(D-aspartate) O-methyltransferase